MVIEPETIATSACEIAADFSTKEELKIFNMKVNKKKKSHKDETENKKKLVKDDMPIKKKKEAKDHDKIILTTNYPPGDTIKAKKKKRHDKNDTITVSELIAETDQIDDSIKPKKNKKTKKESLEINSNVTGSIVELDQHIKSKKNKKDKNTIVIEATSKLNDNKDENHNIVQKLKKKDGKDSAIVEESSKPKKRKKNIENEKVDGNSKSCKIKKKRKLDISESILAQVDKSGVTLLLFYAYVEPEWSAKEYDIALKWSQEAASLNNISGRLRVAKEGFNGTMTGSYDDVRNWCKALREFSPKYLGNTDFKLTDNLPEGQAFPNLKVFPVIELVNYGLDGKQPSLKNGGIHLSAEEYHRKMEEENTVIIDIRNSYEAAIGHFKPPPGGAEYIDPKMRVSTEFPAWVDNNKARLEGKQIMMFCTGGIRCERASALLKDKGMTNPVFQMQGGIHNYLEKYNEGGGYFKGHNYTFDKRFLHGAKDAEIIGNCNGCQTPFNKYRHKKRCLSCGVPLLICESCQTKKLELVVVCQLCNEQNMKVTKKFKKDKGGVKRIDCGVCGVVFESRNKMFKHLNETGHADRKSRKK